MALELNLSTPSSDHSQEADDDLFSYHMHRVVTARFGCHLEELSGRQLSEAARQAELNIDLENQVLASPAALGVVILPRHVSLAIADLNACYPDRDAFMTALGRDGLTIDALASGLRRQLVYDVVLERVAADHAPVEAADEWAEYQAHPERYSDPERRLARHLLVTSRVLESSPAGAEKSSTWLAELAAALGEAGRIESQQFDDLARRYSDDRATAVAGGLLGVVDRGRLPPELDLVLFSLREGVVSQPVITARGTHLLYCERVYPACLRAFSEVRAAIRNRLIEQRRCEHVQRWLASLTTTGH
ncbi:peptidylprolyl isomerase [Thiocapsa imhoffii]|nr:peptidylprolyl isomerase [Thiocapsa imhoffii]